LASRMRRQAKPVIGERAWLSVCVTVGTTTYSQLRSPATLQFCTVW